MPTPCAFCACEVIKPQHQQIPICLHPICEFCVEALRQSRNGERKDRFKCPKDSNEFEVIDSSEGVRLVESSAVLDCQVGQTCRPGSASRESKASLDVKTLSRCSNLNSEAPKFETPSKKIDSSEKSRLQKSKTVRSRFDILIFEESGEEESEFDRSEPEHLVFGGRIPKKIQNQKKSETFVLDLKVLSLQYGGSSPQVSSKRSVNHLKSASLSEFPLTFRKKIRFSTRSEDGVEPSNKEDENSPQNHLGISYPPSVLFSESKAKEKQDYELRNLGVIFVHPAGASEMKKMTQLNYDFRK